MHLNNIDYTTALSSLSRKGTGATEIFNDPNNNCFWRHTAGVGLLQIKFQIKLKPRPAE